MLNKNLNNGVLEMLIAMILSGFIGLFVFESGQSPMEAVFYRCLMGSIMLGAYCYYKGLLSLETLLQTQIIFVIIGGVALIANWVFLFNSFKFSSISIATTVYHFQPFFLIILNMIFFKERIKFVKTIWLIMAFIGLLLIIELDISQFSGSMDQGLGILMAMAAGFLYAVATLIVKKVKDLKSELVAFIQITLGVFLLLPFVNLEPDLITEYQWFNLFLLAFLNTFVMYIIMYRAFAKLNISILSVMVFIYPVTAIIVDYIFYDQSLSYLQLLGVFIVLASAFLVNFKKS